MKKLPISILPLILPLALAALACSVFVGGPAYPETAIPVSTEDAGTIKQNFIDAATAAAETGTLTISITETQLTTIVAQKLNEQTDPFITDPQVYLRDGKIQIYGKATQGSLQANVRIILTATVDESGKPVISVSSVEFGPLPAPDSMNQAISKMVDEAFTGALGPAATGFRLQSITIADGTMTVAGRIK